MSKLAECLCVVYLSSSINHFEINLFVKNLYLGHLSSITDNKMIKAQERRGEEKRGVHITPS